jgi:VWFA-related protein
MPQDAGQKQDQKQIPDAPSAAKPPGSFPQNAPPAANVPPASPGEIAPPSEPPGDETPKPPLRITTVPEGGASKSNEGSGQLYKIPVNVNQVLVPVTIKDENGRLSAGLVPTDFSVYEDGVKQKMNFFTADPFALSAAVVLDVGMPDVALQKVNKTFPALQGAFSQFDEVAIYTYSSTYSKQSDFTAVGKQLDAVLNGLKPVRGRNNGVPVTGGPLGPQGPTINNIPVDPNVPPVITPAKESHVLNDAVLAAATDLSKRDRSRRKVIFIISDGREYGSTASYSDVLKVLLSNGIIVYAIGVEGAAIPIYGKVERKIHLPRFGYSDILPKYANATGGEVFNELSRSDIEDAYARIMGDARNQYTLGYIAKATPGLRYRQIEVRVDRPGCKNSDLRPCVNVYAKDGYYPLPPGR